MKDVLEFLGLLLVMLLFLSYEGCQSSGLVVTIDGKPHRFSWSVK